MEFDFDFFSRWPGQREKYIIAGPAVIGNSMGSFGRRVPAGRFVVVRDGEHTNGGYGAQAVEAGSYATEEAARAAHPDACHGVWIEHPTRPVLTLNER